jgi:hypothetical protein
VPELEREPELERPPLRVVERLPEDLVELRRPVLVPFLELVLLLGALLVLPPLALALSCLCRRSTSF